MAAGRSGSIHAFSADKYREHRTREPPNYDLQHSPSPIRSRATPLVTCSQTSIFPMKPKRRRTGGLGCRAHANGVFLSPGNMPDRTAYRAYGLCGGFGWRRRNSHLRCLRGQAAVGGYPSDTNPFLGGAHQMCSTSRAVQNTIAAHPRGRDGTSASCSRSHPVDG